MEPGPGGEVSLTFRYTIVPIGSEGVNGLVCLDCHNPLDIHQPDADLPDRMLATCEHCKGWHMIESVPGTTDVLVALLPDLGSLRASRVARVPKRRGVR